MSVTPILQKIRAHYSFILETGARVGATFLLIGLILRIFGSSTAPRMNPGESPWERIPAALQLDPEAVQLIGLFILVITPVVRVLWSIVLYAYAKDRLMTSLALVSLFFIAAGVISKL